MFTVTAKVRILPNPKEQQQLARTMSAYAFTRPQYDLVWNREYSLPKKFFSVNTLDGRIKLQYYLNGMETYFDGSWKFRTAKLVTKKGKWYLHIPLSKDIPELDDFHVSNVAGVDLGVNILEQAASQTAPGQIQRASPQSATASDFVHKKEMEGNRAARKPLDAGCQLSGIKGTRREIPSRNAFCISTVTGE